MKEIVNMASDVEQRTERERKRGREQWKKQTNRVFWKDKQDFFIFLYFIKKTKHVTIFTSKYSDRLQQLRDKLQLHYWNDQKKRQKYM